MNSPVQYSDFVGLRQTVAIIAEIRSMLLLTFLQMRLRVFYVQEAWELLWWRCLDSLIFFFFYLLSCVQSPAFSGLSELCLAVSPDFLDFDINNVLLSV